ncbi:GNAT family N-acetyltransferase [Streptococcus sp. zg-86]|uniref:GNAT family N-acetyltransferase n=1 Tax=Streptococcus zhangguiae TaxID=2664091 RepID=A0A6I4RD48_9STRE|nr:MULTISPECIES: GNAT family N-acetyltransferase [unclassified Streptococcus]MTB64798.1 GNAT family N-acetyltransferase [Streptococcus sp. zg-86]MTB91455.1 GNAT family N-acetyltransferase [Streptococcus sp. zg-36]MWV56698.1 GNAT family N-acetyltransferase [Streptococcus sp. zg-70]QTH48432.1 GNAT family N-acetyltransferase [Streptococcus sp. zg-86]
MTIWEPLARYAYFETDRLLLRPFSYEDREDLHAILSNPLNTEYLMPSAMNLAETTNLLVHTFLKSPLGIWAIEEKETGQMIGCIRFENIEEKKKEAEIGYFLRQSFWGQGLMTEVLQTLAYLAIHHMVFQKISVITHIENTASQRVAEKAGFQKVRQYKGSDRYSHRMREYLAFQLLARDKI